MLVLLAGSTAGAQVTINWNNPAGGSWGLATNWDPQNIPNAAGEEAVFPAGGGTFLTYLSGNITVDRVLIDNPDATVDMSTRTFNFTLPDGIRNAGTLLASANSSQLNGFLDNLPGSVFRIPEAGIHYFSYDSLRNEGTIHIGTAGGTSDASLYFRNANRLMTGSGQCVLESLWVTSTDRANHGTLAASNGGTLVIGTATTTQGPTGVILADGGTVRMENTSRIVGGTLSTANGGVIEGNSEYHLTEITNTGRLDLLGGARVYWGGVAGSTNDGTVTINADASATDAILYLYNGAVPIEGTGAFVLSTAGDVNDAQLQPYYGSMIQGAGHTIRGEGSVYCGIDNHGTISADVGGRVLYLATQPKTNRSLMRAMNNGILQIGSGDITQEPGAMILADGGIVRLIDNSRVTGGSFNTANGGIVEIYASSYLTNVTNLGAMALPEGSIVFWTAGQSVNNGTVTINPAAGAADAVLYACNGTLNLAGTGEIVMRTAGDPSDAQLNRYFGDLVNGSEHTIRGEGRIITALMNDGLVSADVPGRVLQLDGGTKTNNNVMRAAGGGQLLVYTTVNQAADGILLADGGTIQLADNSTVNGGVLRTSNGGWIEGRSSHSLNNITNDGDLRILAGGSSFCGGTTFVNNGTLAINREQSATDAILYAYNGTVRIEGNGQIALATAGDVADAQVLGYFGSFVQAPNHTIRGEGLVSVGLNNEGTVRADVPGRRLHPGSQDKINKGLMEAADSSMLWISSGFVNHARVVARGGAETRIDQMSQNYTTSTRTLTGGRWEVHDGSTLRLMGVDPLRLNAGVLLSGPTSLCCRDEAGTPTLDHLNTIQLEGSLEIAAGRDFATPGGLSNAGRVDIGTGCQLTVPGAFAQTGYNPTGIQHEGAGWTTVDGTFSSTDTLRFGGGTLMGMGTIAGNVKSSARVSPGTSASAGTLTIAGGYVQTATGHLYVELGDPQPGQHDVLTVTGHAQLSGRLWVAQLEGYTPSAGDVFTVMTFASRTGEFTEKWGCAGVGLDYEIIYEPQAVKIMLVNAPTAVEEPTEPTDPVPGVDPVVVGPDEGLLPPEVRLTARAVAGESCLELDLPREADVLLEAFDLTGRRVAVLEGMTLAAGTHHIAWTTLSHSAARLPSGAYLARATVSSADGTTIRSTRILLVR